MCRHVFYSVPSRLIGHRLRLRLHDERIEAYLGGTFLLALPRGRRAKGGRAVHVVDYRHVISALRAKPGRGWFGEVVLGEQGTFRTELRGLTQALAQRIGERPRVPRRPRRPSLPDAGRAAPRSAQHGLRRG